MTSAVLLRSGRRLAAAGILAAIGFLAPVHAGQSRASDIELQLGNQLFTAGRYQDAIAAYQRALGGGSTESRAARSGLVRSALRVADFVKARRESEVLVGAAPDDPAALALHADALWSSGLFEEAERRYRDVLAIAPDATRGHDGLARALAARGRLREALVEAQAAIDGSPREAEPHHTIGTIYERLGRIDEAIQAFRDYVNLLPNQDRSLSALRARASLKFLQSFGPRMPLDTEPGGDAGAYALAFRIVEGKMVVSVKVNGGIFQDFIIDTGAERAVVSRATAERNGVEPVTYTPIAGVGGGAVRDVELGRMDSLELGTLKVLNVPCLIDEPRRGVPKTTIERVSPLALGFSMIIDYGARRLLLTRHPPRGSGELELPLWVDRLAMVQVDLNVGHPAMFVVDTGGEEIAISQAAASSLDVPPPARKIWLKIFGASGWDRSAFLLPGLTLGIGAITYVNYPVEVLDLQLPSALLGVQIGGILGERFLSRYLVTFDLDRSVLRLKKRAGRSEVG